MWAFLVATAMAADLPSWTQGQTLERNGSILRVVCVGTAPSLDLAREQANSACRSEAIRQVQTSMTVRSESVESEHEVAFHQEIRSDVRYAGLDCKPENESILPGPDQTTVYRKCSYNLDKISATKVNGPAQPLVMIQSADNDSLSDEVPQVSEDTSEHGFKKDSLRHIVLSTIPGACDTVIVHGSGIARIVKCTEYPQVLTVDMRTAKSLVIRPKIKGYMPKTVPINGRTPATMEVQFEQQ